MKAQGFLEIDYQEMTDDQYSEFLQQMQSYLLDFYRVDEGSREYYLCIIQDDSKLPELLELLSSRNPVLNGVWDAEAVAQTDYTFSLSIHLSHTPKDICVNEDGSVTEVEVTEFRPLHQFAGWPMVNEY